MHKFCHRYLLLIFLTALLMAGFMSCSPSRKLQKRGGYMLSANTVKTDRAGISVYDLTNFAQPKPNRRFLGVINHKVWIYDAFSGGKDSKLKRWMRTHPGEPPVLLDSALIDNSLIPMKVYLNNKGYFGATVTRSIKFRGARALVEFQTHTSQPFSLGTISYTIKDDSIRYFVNKIQDGTLLKPGKQYDAYLIRDERERLTRELKDIGYFAFIREYIFFEVDTNARERMANINILIQNLRKDNVIPGSPADTGSGSSHLRYFFNNVFVHTSQRVIAGDTIKDYDTLCYYKEPDLTRRNNPDFYQIFNEKPRLRSEALARSIFIKPGEPFDQKNVNLTYNRLQNLALTRFVSVNVLPPRNVNDSMPNAGKIGLLDCDIRMVRSPVNMYTIEAEGTNAGGFVGLGGSLNYQNRNIFRGAETLRLRLYGAMEIRPPLGVEDESDSWLFNSLEGGFQAGLYFPTLLSPIKIYNPGQNSRAITSVAIGFNYQKRPEYLRYISSISLGYEWKASQTSTHIFSPIDISSTSILRDSAFTDYLNSLNDVRFLNQYTDHLIMAMKYSYIFNNQSLQSKRNFYYLRLNLESAGNLLNFFSNVSNATPDASGDYTMFGIKYAQYFRGDIDFRYYKPISENHKVVYRVAFGIGLPYGNSSSLPFEKGFFAGGANGLRGWPARSLGPGGYQPNDSVSYEKIGDLWIEANLEYRFPIYSFLQGALFTDAGNIWLVKENDDFPEGNFTFDRMFKTIAFDAGLGFRFDFSFFIFRIDAGLPLYDPGENADNKWFRSSKFQMKDINWNFGIGYPF